MLKTSPILSDSGNASPTSFRYAPASSSPQSSFRHPPAVRRRQSTRSSGSSTDSMKSESHSRPNHCVTSGVDTQVAQMEGLQPQKTPLSQHISEPPPPHQFVANQASAGVAPTTTTPATSSITTASTTSAGPSHTLTTPLTTPKSHVENAVSPNKRRGSPGPSIAQATEPGSTGTGESASQTTKRARPDAPPPKILPIRYELCPVEHMVELIAHMLAELIATNDAIRISNGGLTRFHSRTAPGISVRDYLHRLARHATLTPPLLLAMVYYIDRLCALYQEFTINTLTVHRFLITAATVASKGLSDSFWNNTTYARVGGVRVAELKLLELEFLYRVDWKIVPNPEVLVAYYKGLVERTPGYALESDGSEDEDEDDEEGEESDQ